MARGAQGLLSLLSVLLLLSAPVMALAQPSAPASDSPFTPDGSSAGEHLTQPYALEPRPVTPSSSRAAPDYPDGFVEFEMGGVSEYHMIIPRDTDLERAEVTLRASAVQAPVPLTYYYNYSIVGSSNAWSGQGSSSATGPPENYESSPFIPGDFTQIATDDGVAKSTQITGSQNPYHHFAVSLQKFPITQLTISWKGRASTVESPSSATATIYVYNGVTEEWESIGSNSASTYTRIDFTTSEDADDYLAPDGYMHILALGERSQQQWGSIWATIYTDWLEVKAVTSWWYTFNPSLDIGGNGGTPDWLYFGVFRTEQTLDEPDFKNRIQEAIDVATAAASPDQYNIDVVFKFSSLTKGKIELVNWVLKKESPPYIFLPDETFTILEDIDTPKLIDLWDFTSDDGEVAAMIYSVAKQEDSSRLSVRINADGHHLDVETPTNDWSGSAWFQIQGSDDTLKTSTSNKFHIGVTPVNDRPKLINPGLLVADEGVPFTYVLRATDPDGDDLIISTNTDLFSLQPVPGTPNSALIAFTPTNEQVGEHPLSIVITDPSGWADNRIVVLNVRDLNIDPTLDTIDDIVATEDKPFELQLMAEDEDLPNGDVLRFADDSPFFDVSRDGKIYFIPTNEMVGTSQVTFSVADARGGYAEQTVSVTVINVNDPPVIPDIPAQIALEDEPFELRVDAFDPDFGDQLQFSDDSEMFDINTRTGKITFNPTQENVGTHKIAITVKDKHQSPDRATFTLEVINVNDPPANATITINPPDGKIVQGDKIILEGTATDSDKDELEYSWEDSNGINLGTGRSFVSSDLPPGSHDLILVVKDEAGLTTTATVTIKVESANTGPAGTTTVGGVPYFVLLAIVATAVVAGGLVVWHRTKPLAEELAEADTIEMPLPPPGSVPGPAVGLPPPVAGSGYLGAAEDSYALPPPGGAPQMLPASTDVSFDANGTAVGAGPPCPHCGAAGMMPLGSSNAWVCPACGNTQSM